LYVIHGELVIKYGPSQTVGKVIAGDFYNCKEFFLSFAFGKHLLLLWIDDCIEDKQTTV
jgi:hypothetical protein